MLSLCHGNTEKIYPNLYFNNLSDSGECASIPLSFLDAIDMVPVCSESERDNMFCHCLS